MSPTERRRSALPTISFPLLRLQGQCRANLQCAFLERVPVDSEPLSMDENMLFSFPLVVTRHSTLFAIWTIPSKACADRICQVSGSEQLPVKTPILNRFRDMMFRDGLLRLQVRKRPGHPKDLVVSTGAERELLHGALEKP